VCQHVHLTKHHDLVYSLGIDHFFWSHTSRSSVIETRGGSVAFHPFPLFAVNYQLAHPARSRDLLFSFVGATSNQWYLSSSRKIIGNLLVSDRRGYVVLRDQWHYQRIVYDHQILGAPAHEDADSSRQASEFRDLLARSIFTLCPSGTGPNSIRLWEAIGAGSIPVILSDKFLPPGPEALWLEAAIFCSETEKDIEQLPRRLRELEQDKELLKRKRLALKQIWLKYGHDCFVYDAIKLFLDGGHLPTAKPQPADHGLSSLIEISLAISAGDTDLVRAGNILWQGLYTRATLYPDDLQTAARERPELLAAARTTKKLLTAKTQRFASQRVCTILPELT
jgi:hypothetical protein